MIDRTLNYGRPLIRRFLEDSRPFSTVLDIGAGNGDDLALARQVNPAARCVGIECHPPYIDQLKARGVEVHALNIERDAYPFAPESLDVVIANQILEHTKELFWIFDQISRALKPGGHFIIGVPNLAALHNRILLALGRQPSPLKNDSAHVRGFTKPDLLNFCRNAFPGGYKLRRSAGSNFYPFPPFVARPLAALFPNMAASLFVHLQKSQPYRGEFLKYPVTRLLETNFYLGK